MKQAIIFLFVVLTSLSVEGKKDQELWPDGTVIGSWFSDVTKVSPSCLGKRFVVTDFGVTTDSTIVQTDKLQAIIEKCASEGGGVIVIPKGTFLSGSLFFHSGTHLMVEKGGILKGSNHIEGFPLMETRIEGETCKYFPALINADSTDGFTICGNGIIDGNGLHYWKQFWIRKKWNRNCTNKDEQRPRLVYISRSKNITVQDVTLQNSPFWTNHLYKSNHVRYLDCTISAPTEGVKAPSSDAIDIDACNDVLVHGCHINVNDDAIALKGGKGTWADKDPNNGPNSNIIIENCRFGKVHGCLTLGSESIENHNIIMRNSISEESDRLLWLKMRPDTPQHYEFVKIENITGKTGSILVVRPWTQFFKQEERKDQPLSKCNDIVLKDINMECSTLMDVGKSEKYLLADFSLHNISVTERKNDYQKGTILHLRYNNVTINGVEQPE